MELPNLIDDIQSFNKKNLDVPEIRVWSHPHYIEKEGEDSYEVFDSFEEALRFIKSNPMAEETPLIAFRGYEINIFLIQERK